MGSWIRRALLAWTAMLTVWAPLAFGHGRTPPAAWEARTFFSPILAHAGALVVAAAVLAAAMLLAALLLVALRCWASGPSRLATPVLAGSLLALLVWVLPWLSLHDTHHALERGEPACEVAQIVHSQGGGILPATVALATISVTSAVPLTAPAPYPSRSAPPHAARSPPA